MAMALGVRFLDAAGVPVEPVGGALARIRHIDMADLDPRVGGVQIEAVCDVETRCAAPPAPPTCSAPRRARRRTR